MTLNRILYTVITSRGTYTIIRLLNISLTANYFSYFEFHFFRNDSIFFSRIPWDHVTYLLGYAFTPRWEPLLQRTRVPSATIAQRYRFDDRRSAASSESLCRRRRGFVTARTTAVDECCAGLSYPISRDHAYPLVLPQRRRRRCRVSVSLIEWNYIRFGIIRINVL